MLSADDLPLLHAFQRDLMDVPLSGNGRGCETASSSRRRLKPASRWNEVPYRQVMIHGRARILLALYSDYTAGASGSTC